VTDVGLFLHQLAARLGATIRSAVS
jgi:hypothetical protein